MHEDIAKILLMAKAISLSPKKMFTFSSGLKGPIYCDNRLLLSFPKEREIISHKFLKLIEKNKLKFDVVAGTAIAGIPWAALIASRLRKPMIFVRNEAKAHGKQNQIEGVLNKDDKVLVVEDLISSGGSSINTVNALRSKKAKVTDVIAIFSYNMKKSEEQFKKEKIRLNVLCNLDDLLDVAVDKGDIDKKEKVMILKWRDNI